MKKEKGWIDLTKSWFARIPIPKLSSKDKSEEEE